MVELEIFTVPVVVPLVGKVNDRVIAPPEVRCPLGMVTVVPPPVKKRTRYAFDEFVIEAVALSWT
jgi:hypothetical protein